jgi:ELWxxDGT repeat protein
VTALDLQGLVSSGYLTTAIYQADLYLTDGTQVVRVPAGSSTAESMISGGWDRGITRLAATEVDLFLVEHVRGMPTDPIQDVLWRFNGTTKALDRIGQFGEIAAITALGDSVYFSDTSGGTGSQVTQLMRVPHAAKTASKVAVLVADRSSSGINSVAAGNLLYLQVKRNLDWELWASDGTAAGTRKVTDIWLAGDGASEFNYCPCLAAAGNQIYFDKKVGQNSVELWTAPSTDTPEYTEFVYLPHLERR